MKYQLSSDSTSAVVNVSLQSGEQVRVQRGSVVSYTPQVGIEGKTNGGTGGVFAAFGKAIVTGESIFKTIVTAHAPEQVVTIAPSTLGAIKVLSVGTQNQWRINDQAFLACDISVDYNVKRQNLGKVKWQVIFRHFSC
jgi:uncharacterized protein (AIM24 family)